jgi:putative addiction module component (TIGR02574 family)
MADPARELESKALRLSARERARLAERLISSLEHEADADAEALWLEEAEKRLDELESGEATGLPAAEVFAKSRSTRR